MQPETPAQYIHPLTGAIRDIMRIFSAMGFTLARGPEVEDEWHNFTALNVPPDHPSRDMQDTFWLPDGRVLRTHTSPVQIRWMETHQPPIRIIAPGRVYRNEATDMTHEAQFYQLEGLVVGPDITLALLKGTLARFMTEFFHGDVEVRLRPSFFGFTEPSVEVDIMLSGGSVPEKLRGRWVEVLGAGMVHPKVLSNCGIDPRRYQGFAFGAGVERLAMFRWSIDELRLFHNGDVRFVQQFPAERGNTPV